MFRLLYTLIILFAFIFAEDVYPNFSDAKKQLEFQNERITIKKIDETNRIISGVLETDTTVAVEYISIYEIIKGNQQITGFEFIQLIDLQEEVDRIKQEYRIEMEIFKNEPTHDVKKGGLLNKIGYWTTYFGAIYLLTFLQGCEEYGLCSDIVKSGSLIMGGGILLIFSPKVKETVEKPYPVLKQQLSIERIKALTESYNRRIYKEIQESN